RACIYVLFFFFYCYRDHRALHSFPTRRSSDLRSNPVTSTPRLARGPSKRPLPQPGSSTERGLPSRSSSQSTSSSMSQSKATSYRSEEHTSELQSRGHLVCRLLLEKKKTQICEH